jgi:Peroxin-3
MSGYLDHSRRRRERPTLTTIVSVAAAAYGTYHLTSWAWKKWKAVDNEQQNDSREATTDHNPSNEPKSNYHEGRPGDIRHGRSPMNPRQWRSRRQRMVRCGDETKRALQGLLPSLRRAIEETTDVSKETQMLKKLRASGDGHQSTEAISLWETVKVRAVTRVMATAYAHSILLLVVTVQIHLLGGKLFEEQLQSSSTKDSGCSSDSSASDVLHAYGESHKIVLKHTYKYFFEHGVPALVKSVERTVSSALETWKFSDASCLSITRRSFDDALNRIRAADELAPVYSTSGRPRSLLRFLIPRSEGFTEDITDNLAGWILDETWDLLESPVVYIAYTDCLDLTFARMRDGHWGKIFERNEHSDDIAEPVARPLAQVISRLKHTSRSFFETQYSALQGDQEILFNSYCEEIQSLASIMELADVSFG